MQIGLLLMLKNESLVLREFFEHYTHLGISHFQVINNGSTDPSPQVLRQLQQDYLSVHMEIVHDAQRQKLGTQNVLYQKWFPKEKIQCDWLLIVDIDEQVFVQGQTLTEYLQNLPQEVSQIVLPWRMFGSNGHVVQPPNIRSSFTRRESLVHFQARINEKNVLGHCKCLTRVRDSLGWEVHASPVTGRRIFSDGTPFQNSLDAYTFNQPLLLNHYTHFSKNYYLQVKIKRHGGQGRQQTLQQYEEEEKFMNQEEDRLVLLAMSRS